jgi:hypothetical protein
MTDEPANKWRSPNGRRITNSNVNGPINLMMNIGKMDKVSKQKIHTLAFHTMADGQ